MFLCVKRYGEAETNEHELGLLTKNIGLYKNNGMALVRNCSKLKTDKIENNYKPFQK